MSRLVDTDPEERPEVSTVGVLKVLFQYGAHGLLDRSGWRDRANPKERPEISAVGVFHVLEQRVDRGLLHRTGRRDINRA